MNSIIKTFILLVTALFLGSCLNGSEQNEQRDQLTLTFNLENANNEITSGEDTLSINLVRFLVGNNYLYNDTGDTLLINQNVFQLNYSTTDGLSQEVIQIAQGSFDSDAVYRNLNFEIKKAEANYSQNPDIDDAFTEDGGELENQRYSMIIDGSYNGEPFTFKSTRNLAYSFTFPDLTGGQSGNLIYNLFVKTNVENWFLNSDATALLDPLQSSNEGTINDNIETSIALDL
jgi:hypothetical protein